MLQRLENMSFEVANNAATFLNKICRYLYIYMELFLNFRTLVHFEEKLGPKFLRDATAAM